MDTKTKDQYQDKNENVNVNQSTKSSKEQNIKTAGAVAAGVLVGNMAWGMAKEAKNIVEDALNDKDNSTASGEEQQTLEQSGEVAAVNADSADTMSDTDVDPAQISDAVSDDMSFNEAFAAARADVGPGGVFQWHGKLYGTYYKEEWDNLSSDDVNNYWASVEAADVNTDQEIAPDNTNDYVHSVMADLDNDGYKETAFIDSNNDNEFDTVTSDTNRDGNIDTVVADTDYDGKVDVVVADTNHDGVVDYAASSFTDDKGIVTVEAYADESDTESNNEDAVDLNEDGYKESILIDSDNDGKMDALASDTDTDGAIDTLLVDTNGDGTADTLYADTDGDGNFDYSESDENIQEFENDNQIDLDNGSHIPD